MPPARSGGSERIEDKGSLATNMKTGGVDKGEKSQTD
jgi:hypothetical protein